MRLKSRERTARIFLVAMMDSDLSLEELREVADSLTGGTLARDLAALLKDVVNRLTNGDEGEESYSEFNDFVEMANATVQGRRIPKRTLLNFVKRASPHNINWAAQSNSTVREILREFCRTASKSEMFNLLQMLREDKRSDAYLKGIVDRD